MKVTGSKVFIYGMIEKNDVYYILKEKEDGYYSSQKEDGNIEYNIMDAAWYKSYGDAKRMLETFDEPEMWDIIRISCLVKLEEIM